MKLSKTTIPTRRSFSEKMLELGEQDRDFVVFEADIGYSTYSYLFGEKFPERYFNMGIAEVGTTAAAAGMAAGGRTVIVSSYGVFHTMRALEVTRSFICYPNLNVKILSSHGGLTAAIDGVTHQATEDIAFMSTLPNMKVLSPCDPVSASAAFELALKTQGPVFTRLMRDPLYNLYNEGECFTMGGSKTVVSGQDITIVSYGDILFQSIKAAELLKERGISAEVMDMYSIKPYDAEGLLKSIKKTGALLVAENHQKKNGLGYELGIFSLKTHPVFFDNLGLDDTFAESGDYEQVINKYGLSADAIAQAAERLVEKKGVKQC